MTTPDFTGVSDPYGVPLIGVTEQTDTITLTGSASALTKTGIVSYPSLETAGASPTADVITVYDVTTTTTLVLNTDYSLTASGSAPEALTYSVTRLSGSTHSSSGDTCRVTYRWGTVPDTSYNAGDFEGEPGAAPMGTAFEASNQATTGSAVAGIGDQAAGGSLTDPAMGTQSSSETGSPGSEYKVTETSPGAFGSPLGAPDTEGVYGGGTPENFSPVLGSNYSQGNIGSTTDPDNFDTTVAGGSDLVPSMYSSPNGYRAPSAGVAAATKDTTLTDILGNQVNDTPVLVDASYAATVIDTSYIGAPAEPTPLLTQTDAFAAAQAGSPQYLSQSGIIPSTVVVTDTSTTTTLVLNTDYTLTTSGNGPTLAAYITPETGTSFTNGNNISVAYSYGDATYWDSNPPASVPGAPTMNSVTAVNRGVKVSWSAPSTDVYIQYYLLQASDLGTMYVPYTGQPVSYGQPSPSGGADTGQPTFQSDALTLLAAALAAPASAPSLTTATTGGTVLAGTYHAIVTYVNGNGETTGSAAGSVTTTGTTSTVTVPSPAAETGATGWYAYLTQLGGSTYTRQQAAGSPTAVGTAFVLTAPPASSGANPPSLNTTIPTLSKTGILTPPGQLIVRDITSSGQSILTSGEIAGGEADPLQADGQVLEYGYDYTVTTIGTGPWTQYQIALVASSVNARAGDSVTVDYWWGADPSSVAAVFTQGLVQNTPVIYRPDGTTPYSQGYRFKVAAGNQIGLGPFSAWSSYAVPLNYNEAQPGSEGSINVGTGSLDPANATNPIYRPDGTVKSGTGLGG
jgi:hypothetical protein